MSNIIEVKDVKMTFNLAKEKIDSLKEYFIKFAKRELVFQEFTALNNISFDVKKGEIVGIVGLNGSGKSTLLKVISGILKPSKGSVKINGSISPLIELGAGFDPELTARENIFLNGYVLGYSKTFIENVYDDIVDFSELKEFIDVPIKNFSSGMYARLGFAIATLTKPDILIVDEVLSVGDFKFQEKCEHRIQFLMSEGTTVLFVSHAEDQVERLCKRVIWLEKGVMKLDGETKFVMQEYRKES